MDGIYYKCHPDDKKFCNNFLNESNSHKNDKYFETALEKWNEFHEISDIYNHINDNSFQIFHKNNEIVMR